MHYFMGLPYEPNTTQILLDRLKSGDVFVDIGANHGFFSVIAGHLLGAEGKVIAFEPNQAVFLQLQVCIDQNGLANVVIARNEALTDSDATEANLYISQIMENSGLSTLAPPCFDDTTRGFERTRYLQVRCRTFDSVAKELGLNAVALVKIDVEGVEDLVLRGMDATLEQCPPRCIIMETTEWSPSYRRLISRGYQARLSGPVSQGFGNFLFEL